jgi:hypothetical protein
MTAEEVIHARSWEVDVLLEGIAEEMKGSE